MNKIPFKTGFYVGASALVAFVMIATLDFGMVNTLLASGKSKLGSDKAPTQMNNTIKMINESFVNASEAVLPSVVSISVEAEVKENGGMQRFGGGDQDFREFFKFFGPNNPFGNDSEEGEDEGKAEQPKDKKKKEKNSPRTTQGAGSGVIVTSDGYIVTNNHVVENAIEDGIKVVLNDKREYTAKLIGTDPLTDLAVIKIEGTNFTPAHFSKIEDVKIGEFVIAVGNPLGLNSTVTSGIVSAIGRGRLGLGKGAYSVENYIQTDAAINPGNSGGGLFDLNGSLIGINTAIATGTGNYIGYGFAIPIDMVQSVVSDLMDDGQIDRGYIGVQIRSLTDEVDAKGFGLSKVEGVVVSGVLPDGAAKAAGIEEGDVILELDGKVVNTSNELQSKIIQHRAGDKVSLVIWRDGKKINKTVTLKSKDNEDVASKKDDKEKEKVSDNEPVSFDDLGFTVKPIDSKMKKDFDVENGVMVSDVKRFSPAGKRNLISNGIITKADRKTIKNSEELKDIIESKKPGDVLLLQVKYKESNQMVALEIPKKQG